MGSATGSIRSRPATPRSTTVPARAPATRAIAEVRSSAASPMLTGRGTETGLPLRRTSGTAITFIDDRPALFAETCRSLFSVNDLAGYIGCRLEDGIEFGTLVDEIVERGLSTAEATAALHSLVVDWSRRGIAEAAFRPPGP